MPTTPRRPRTTTPLSRQRIVAAAMALADRHGVDELSMRKLATDLGCEVMSLYNHVANKDDLIDEMVELAAAEIAEGPPGLRWDEAVRVIAVSAKESMVRHPWSGPLWAGRFPGPVRMRHMDSLLAALGRSRLPSGVVDLGFHAVSMHIEGYVQQALAFRQGQQAMSAAAAQFLASEHASRFPHLLAHFEYHRLSDDDRDDFVLVLDLILDGLRRIGRREARRG